MLLIIRVHNTQTEPPAVAIYHKYKKDFTAKSSGAFLSTSEYISLSCVAISAEMSSTVHTRWISSSANMFTRVAISLEIK